MLGATLLAACSSDVDTGRRCKPGDTRCTSSRGDGGLSVAGSGSGHAGSSASLPEDAALRAHIEDANAIQIDVVTLSCAGECAEIVAVARGGIPPYTFAWDDGETSARRQVCLQSSDELSVHVQDTKIESDEFYYGGQTTSASVSVTVLECPGDGGTSDACLDNPSFEGTVTPTQLEAFSAPPWNACYTGGLSYSAIGDETLWPFQNWTFPAPSDGETYLALGQQGLFTGRAAQTLCEPLRAGTSRSFLVDLARAVSTDPAAEALERHIEVLGGNDECSENVVLWTSPELTTTWTTHCVTLSPNQDVTTLSFRAFGSDGGLMEGLVDNLVFVPSCP
jgi:hypothetical protein